MNKGAVVTSKLSKNSRPRFNQFRITLVTLFVLLLPCSASYAWECSDTYRCREHKLCLFDDFSMRCSYGSSSAVSGGLSFENGAELFIEWVFDEDGIRFDVSKDSIALVNGVKTEVEVLNFGENTCVKFAATKVNPSFAYGEC